MISDAEEGLETNFEVAGKAIAVLAEWEPQQLQPLEGLPAQMPLEGWIDCLAAAVSQLVVQLTAKEGRSGAAGKGGGFKF
ncbi:unnamed protein product [Lampetra fluviatilis]